MAKILTVLKITRGEYEFMSYYTHDDDQSPDDIAKEFYGEGNGEAGDDGYYFNCGEVHVKVVRSQEISVPEYEVLHRLLGI